MSPDLTHGIQAVNVTKTRNMVVMLNVSDIPLVVLNQQKLMSLKLMKFNYTHTHVCVQ